jgi:dipeptide/tripeptide permease
MKDTYKSFETAKEKEAYGLADTSNTDQTSITSSTCDIVDIEKGKILRKPTKFTILGFPPHVMLMLLVEFCERFSFYGIRSVLSVYLQNKLGYTQSESSQAYHFYIAICYITPILGGIIADQYWGKYKTILVLGLVYALGNGVVSAGSILNDSPFLIFCGLALISIGTGGIKPCISSFCGDQLDPNNEKKREQFFSVFYVCINVGAVISSFMTPQWARPERHDDIPANESVGCFGHHTDCYPKAFGIPSILMLVALFLFVLGTKFYTINGVKSNVFTKFIKTTIGIETNGTSEFKSDCRRVLRIFSFILPVTLFWAIFDQAGSTFTFQSAQLDKTMAGTFFEKIPIIGQSWVLEDQVEAINPVIIVFMTPFFTLVLYPFIMNFYKLTALRKIAFGMVINAIVCGFALYLQNKIDADFTYIFPENNANSPLANATFVYQIHRPDNPDFSSFAKSKISTHNFDVYDEYKLDKRNELEKMFLEKDMRSYENLRKDEIYKQVDESGKTSTRFWTWSNKLGQDSHRNDEAILHPDDFESRLDDKQHCSKAWKKDLPYVEIESEFGSVDYLIKPASLNKFIVFNDQSVGVMAFNITRPIQGRARLDIISRKYFCAKKVGLVCKNDLGYLNKDPFMNLNEFEYPSFIVEGETKEKPTEKPILSKVGRMMMQEEVIPVGEPEGSGSSSVQLPISELPMCSCLGRASTNENCNCNLGRKRRSVKTQQNSTENPSKTGAEKMDDSLKYHVPEHTYADSHSTSTEAQIITHPAVEDIPLYIASYLIPQGSLCQFKQNTNDEIKDIKIGASGLYSIVDFETDPEKEERSWSKEVNEDVNALKHSFGWQFVLYCISTASEIMISVSGLEYTYAQAPKSMKAVVSSLWLLPVFLGNIYDIYMGTQISFKRHAFKIHKFNVYFSVFATLVFMWIASKYQTVEEEEKQRRKEESAESGEKAALNDSCTKL